MSHTPGPWDIGIAPEEQSPTYLIGSMDLIWGRIVGSPGRDTEADARLIVKAPEMLALLKTAAKCIEAATREDYEAGLLVCEINQLVKSIEGV